jgi:dTDP-glucose pyrophosphorylase/CBS domain-containing protein
MINDNPQFWRSAMLPADANIQMAIRCLEMSGLQIVLVVSATDVLLGTLTDGDIRRALLRGLTLDSKIDDVMNHSPLVVPPDIGKDHVINIMRANKLRQIPVVESGGRVVNVYLWDSDFIIGDLSNFMIIMAGGRGTRLHPHTNNCPKPMLKVNGKPILERIIESSRAEGFHNFLISINYLGHVIEDYFGDGQKLGVSIEYLREDSPLGTAGSLSCISAIPCEPIVVTNGDVLTDVRYRDILNFHIRHKSTATMAVRQYEIQNQFGVVRVKGLKIEGFDEKPIYRSHINAGIYVLDPIVLTQLEANQYCDMPVLFERTRVNIGPTIAYPMHEPWLDIGRPEDLNKANI